MHGDVEKLLRDLIRAHRGLEAEHVGLDARFIEDLGFDSRSTRRRWCTGTSPAGRNCAMGNSWTALG